VQHIFYKAKRQAQITKNVSVHSLRHAFATHLLESGKDISVIQKLLGHRSIQTTSVYVHVASNTLKNVRSPLDALPWPAVETPSRS
jgi:integrase/recombinase XerD